MASITNDDNAPCGKT